MIETEKSGSDFFFDTTQNRNQLAIAVERGEQRLYKLNRSEYY
jgi:hypothetical protein